MPTRWLISMLIASSPLLVERRLEFVTSRARAAQAQDVSGCYRADRPLGTAASIDGVPGAVGRQIGEQGEALKTLAAFRLLAGGAVDRPGAFGRSSWQRGSRWSVASDTLLVTLSTGASGWALHLVPAGNARDEGYVGTARYLSDVVVKDTSAWKPPIVTVRVRRESCSGDA